VCKLELGRGSGPESCDIAQSTVARNDVRRNAFLAREIEAHRRELESAVKSAGLAYECRTVLGKPAESLIAYANDVKPDLILMGSPRPKGCAGIRSRMQLDALVAALDTPLLVIPRPA